jgi:hypothetical protein
MGMAKSACRLGLEEAKVIMSVHLLAIIVRTRRVRG